MTLNVETLPEALQSAINQTAERKASFIVARDRCRVLAERVERHGRTAAHAEQEAKTARASWRDLFRKSDGERTKEISAIRRKESEAAALKDEAQDLANYLRPEYELALLEAVEALYNYDRLRHSTIKALADFRLEEAAKRLFSASEGQQFLRSLKDRFMLLKEEAKQNPLFFADSGLKSELEKVQLEEQRLGERLVSRLFSEELQKLDVEAESSLHSLGPFSLDDIAPLQRSAQEYSSLMTRAKKKKEILDRIEDRDRPIEV